jgi:hypothetical protein
VATDALPLEPEVVRRYQRMAATAGAIGLALCALGWMVAADDCFRSYLWAMCFFVGIALGSLVLVMLQFLTGGVWGLVIRRILEAATRTLPVLALLFLPMIAGFFIPAGLGSSAGHSRPAISGLYIWADPAVVEADHALEFKAHYYLNPQFFAVRAVICFAAWITIALLLSRWSAAQDRPGGGDRDDRRLRMLSAGGLVVYALTVTVMAIDWIMSLEPHWVSSILGPLVGVGQVLTALSFTVIVLVLLSDRPPLSRVIGRPVLRDLGSLMLAFVMVWAYLAFSQLLLIWSGNLPSEIPYYLRRIQGGWQFFAFALAILNFALPFVLLLMGDVKRNRATLLQVASLILVMRAVDLYWLIMPARPGIDGLGWAPIDVSWTNVVAPVGVGGIWLWSFLGQLQRQPLLPAHDPRLGEAVHHD